MKRPPRSPVPGLAAGIRRAVEAHRDAMVAAWLAWIDRRMPTDPTRHRPTIRRQLTLIVDILGLMAGPLRREAKNLWFNATELHGRTAFTRGLAAGEVVEELQYLRELLIRTLADEMVGLPPRQLMAAILRLNRAVDKAIADAVVGYTDALADTLFAQHGAPVPIVEQQNQETARHLDALEAELRELAGRG